MAVALQMHLKRRLRQGRTILVLLYSRAAGSKPGSDMPHGSVRGRGMWRGLKILCRHYSPETPILIARA